MLFVISLHDIISSHVWRDGYRVHRSIVRARVWTLNYAEWLYQTSFSQSKCTWHKKVSHDPSSDVVKLSHLHCNRNWNPMDLLKLSLIYQRLVTFFGWNHVFFIFLCKIMFKGIFITQFHMSNLVFRAELNMICAFRSLFNKRFSGLHLLGEKG